jgi:hypothetical protein
MIKILIRHQDWYEAGPPKSTRNYRILEGLLADEYIQNFLQVNRYQEILWFNKEQFDALMSWMMRTAAVNGIERWGIKAGDTAEQIASAYQVVRKLLKAEKGSGYQVEKLLEMVG